MTLNFILINCAFTANTNPPSASFLVFELTLCVIFVVQSYARTNVRVNVTFFLPDKDTMRPTGLYRHSVSLAIFCTLKLKKYSNPFDMADLFQSTRTTMASETSSKQSENKRWPSFITYDALRF